MSIYVDAIDWMTAVYHNPNARNMWTFFMNTLNDGIKLFVPSYKLCDNLVTRNSKPRVPKLLRKSASKKLHLSRNYVHPQTMCPYSADIIVVCLSGGS